MRPATPLTFSIIAMITLLAALILQSCAPVNDYNTLVVGEKWHIPTVGHYSDTMNAVISVQATLNDTLFYFEDWVRCKETRFAGDTIDRPKQPELLLRITNHSTRYVLIPKQDIIVTPWNFHNETVAVVIGKDSRRLWYDPMNYFVPTFDDYFRSMGLLYPSWDTAVVGLPKGIWDLFVHMPANTGRYWLVARYLNSVDSDTIPDIWTGWAISDTVYFSVRNRMELGDSTLNQAGTR